MKICFRGRTSVTINHLEEDETEVSDVAVLRAIAAKSHFVEAAYDPNEAFTRFIHDGSPFATQLLKVIEPGGWIRFVFDEETQRLLVETEYKTQRPLTAQELAYLTEETVGQWSDGAGGYLADTFSENIDPYYVDIFPHLDDYNSNKPAMLEFPD
jgi:hypothetical protein